MRWQDLIATSRLLMSTPDPNTAPLPDSLRRAVSTAYYAVFHALANSNADCLIGVPTSPLLEHAWDRARRGLDHTPARRNLEQVLATRAGVHNDVRCVAERPAHCGL